MGKEEILSRVKAIIIDKLGVDENEVTNEAVPKFDLGADSLDLVELIMEYEKEFQIKVYNEYYDKLEQVNDYAIYINNYLNNNMAENKKYFEV